MNADYMEVDIYWRWMCLLMVYTDMVEFDYIDVLIKTYLRVYRWLFVVGG